LSRDIIVLLTRAIKHRVELRVGRTLLVATPFASCRADGTFAGFMILIRLSKSHIVSQFAGLALAPRGQGLNGLGSLIGRPPEDAKRRSRVSPSLEMISAHDSLGTPGAEVDNQECVFSVQVFEHPPAKSFRLTIV
jgi:hypothetical protein